MPENQIVLLPKQNYYEWVAAARDYVLKFGPNVTPDPQTAANYYTPNQVITIANPPDGYGRDIVQWFKDNHANIRLDVINTNTPNDFKNALAARIANNTQLAQEAAAFKLRWPTDFPKITQPFGVNPDIYRRFGLPGHEGLDIRAPMNANVYAAADGTVFQVNADGKLAGGGDHSYGIHVRIQHGDGYQTIYAHFMKALVTVGQQVRAGDLIGLADSTGNSTGSHLHLTLKKQGATAAGLTTYPHDIVDPTPFLQDAGTVAPPADTAPNFGWPYGKCLVGVNGRSDGPLTEADYPPVATARIEAVKLLSSARPENVDRLRQINNNMFIMVRLFADFKNRQVRSDEFAAWVEGDMAQFYNRGVRYYEVHNEPNLQIEGWKFSWQDGKEFGRWALDVTHRLKAKFPEAKFGYPGLSPGGSISGQRVDSWAFLGQGDEAARSLDFTCCHCYWLDDGGMLAADGGLVYEEYRRRYPGKLLFITEFSNPNAQADMRTKGNQYVNYYKRLRSLPGLGAAFSFVLSGSSGFPHEVWRLENGTPTDIPGLVGQRNF
ncbi:MAG TPA: M23 family metallopeptidase [Anaerolineales bacterium]|nr:M23 family metallopeptidase [Anaerolineales bacterium]